MPALDTVDEIQSRLKQILLEASTDIVSSDGIADETPLAGKGAAIDSVSLLEVVLRIETEFGIILRSEEHTSELQSTL